MSKRKLTSHQSELRNEYNKQRRRIQQFVRKKGEQGFIIPEDIVPPSVSQLTQSGKSISQKEIQRLSRITPEKIYAQSQFVDISTGEIISAEQGKILARKRQYIDGDMTETYVDPPRYSILEKMKSKFMSLEYKSDQNPQQGELIEEQYRLSLVNYIDRMYADYGADYINHLEFNEATINEECSRMEWSYKQDMFDLGFTQLLKALSYEGHIPSAYAEEIVNLTERYDIEGEFYD